MLMLVLVDLVDPLSNDSSLFFEFAACIKCMKKKRNLRWSWLGFVKKVESSLKGFLQTWYRKQNKARKKLSMQTTCESSLMCVSF